MVSHVKYQGQKKSFQKSLSSISHYLHGLLGITLNLIFASCPWRFQKHGLQQTLSLATFRIQGRKGVGKPQKTRQHFHPYWAFKRQSPLSRHLDPWSRPTQKYTVNKNVPHRDRSTGIGWEGYCPETRYLLKGRMASHAPDIDGDVYITRGTATSGMVNLRVTHASEYDVIGEISSS
jgi:hypothetical protein